jgi:glycosyltransferase involved in cell wall biosynthesis
MFANSRYQTNKRVAIIRIGDIERDPRVRRVAETLLERGHEVRIYSIQLAGQTLLGFFNGYHIYRIPPYETPFDVILLEKLIGTEIFELLNLSWPGLLSNPINCRQLDTSIQKKTISPTPEINPLSTLNKQSTIQRSVKLAKRILPPVIKNKIKNLVFSIMTIPDHIESAQIAIEKPFPTQDNDFSDHRFIAERDEVRWRLKINNDFYNKILEWPTHIYCCDLDTLLAGVMLKRKLNIPLIYDAYEIFPHQWSLDYRSAEYIGFYWLLERLLIPYTDGRITVGHGLAKYFEYAYACKPFEIVPSTPSLNYLVNKKILERKNTPRGILYHGYYAPQRGLDEFIDVVPHLKDCRVAFRGIGDYEQVLRKLVQEKELTNRIEFLPPVQVDKLVSTASDFDIGLLPFVNSCLNTNYAFPNKLFEYMMAGLAIASSDLVDQTHLIEEYKMGITFNINNKYEVAERINGLLCNPDQLDDMRRNAWNAAKEKYNWEISRNNLIKVLESCGL